MSTYGRRASLKNVLITLPAWNYILAAGEQPTYVTGVEEQLQQKVAQAISRIGEVLFYEINHSLLRSKQEKF